MAEPIDVSQFLAQDIKAQNPADPIAAMRAINITSADVGAKTSKATLEGAKLDAQMLSAQEDAQQRINDVALDKAIYAAGIVTDVQQKNAQLQTLVDQRNSDVDARAQDLASYDQKMNSTKNPLAFIWNGILATGARNRMQSAREDVALAIQSQDVNRLQANKMLVDYDIQKTMVASAQIAKDLGVATDGLREKSAMISGALNANEAKNRAALQQRYASMNELIQWGDREEERQVVKYIHFANRGTEKMTDEEFAQTKAWFSSRSADERRELLSGLPLYERIKASGQTPDWATFRKALLEGADINSNLQLAKASGDRKFEQALTNARNFATIPLRQRLLEQQAITEGKFELDGKTPNVSKISAKGILLVEAQLKGELEALPAKEMIANYLTAIDRAVVAQIPKDGSHYNSAGFLGDISNIAPIHKSLPAFLQSKEFKDAVDFGSPNREKGIQQKTRAIIKAARAWKDAQGKAIPEWAVAQMVATYNKDYLKATARMGDPGYTTLEAYGISSANVPMDVVALRDVGFFRRNFTEAGGTEFLVQTAGDSFSDPVKQFDMTEPIEIARFNAIEDQKAREPEAAPAGNAGNRQPSLGKFLPPAPGSLFPAEGTAAFGDKTRTRSGDIYEWQRVSRSGEGKWVFVEGAK